MDTLEKIGGAGFIKNPLSQWRTELLALDIENPIQSKTSQEIDKYSEEHIDRAIAQREEKRRLQKLTANKVKEDTELTSPKSRKTKSK